MTTYIVQNLQFVVTVSFVIHSLPPHAVEATS